MSEQMSSSFALEQIPQEQKRGWVAMLSVLVAIGVDLSSVLLGAELAAGLPLKEAVLSVVVGSSLLAVLYTVCALVGSSTSLSVSMITKYVFGSKGAKIFSIVICVSLLGWFGVQVGFFAENAQVVLKELLGITVSIKALNLIGGVLMMSTAIIGYSAIERLSVYSVPFLLILMLITVGLAFRVNGFPVNASVEGNMTFLQGASLCMSILIVGAITAPDISRWAKNKKDCCIASFFGVLFGNSFMIIISIILVKTMGTSDIMKVFLALGLAIPGIFVLTLAQWTTNTSNVYSSALGASVVFPKVSIKKLSIIVGLIGTALAVLGIYNKFITFLSFLSVIIAPVGGIYTAEFYIVKDRLHNLSEKQDSPFIFRSIVVWVIGALFTFIVTPAPDGLGLFTLTTIAPLDGFIFAFILQVILGKIITGKKED